MAGSESIFTIERLPNQFVGPILADLPPAARYAAAALVVVAVAGIRDALAPVIGVHAPLLPFGLAVFAAAYLAGIGPAILATATGAAIATFLYADTSGEAELLGWTAHIVLFLILGSLVSMLMHRLQSAYGSQSATLALARAAEERLRTLTDAMPALIAYVGKDERYVFNNKAYCEWFGVTANQLRGAHTRDILGAEAYAAIKPHIEAVLSGQKVHFDAHVPYAAGGHRHVSAHYVPDRAHDGSVRGYFSLVHDAGAQARTAQRLADERLLVSLSMRVGRSGAFEWVPESARTEWSPELLDLYGFGPGEFDGSPAAWLACIHPDDVEHARSLLHRVVENDELEFEFRIRRHDTGDARWMQGRTKTLRDPSNKLTRVIGMNIDITERKRVEEALRESDRQKDRFIAMLSHELRNPLAPISNVAQLLADGRADLDTLRQYGGMVNRQVTTLVRLVDDLLDAARITRGAITIKREPVDIEAVIAYALETVRPMFDARRQTISVAKALPPLTLQGDFVRLEQVVVNLLTNASKFSPLGSNVEVSATTVGGNVALSVRDYGQGIDPALQANLFELFVQAEQGLNRPHGGLGIGLGLVKSIVERHGGTVSAYSAGPGLGSEFTVTLPMDFGEAAKT